MRSGRAWAVVFLVCCVVLSPANALGQTIRAGDPAGDGLKGRSLDITDVRVTNDDHAVLATVSFVRVAHGNLGVAIKARGDHRRGIVGVTSVHRSTGDKNRLLTAAGVLKCRGLKVTWVAATNRVRIRVPSRCIDGGNYGAVKVQAITEIGSDADFAPKSPNGSWRWTAWASRG
jgi:hypothetical protein